MTYRHTKIIFIFQGVFCLRTGLCEAITHNNKLINVDSMRDKTSIKGSKTFSTMKNP